MSMPSSSERLPEFRPTFNHLAKKLAKVPHDRNNALSELESSAHDILWDARFGNYGADCKRQARIGVIYLAFHAYESGEHPRLDSDAIRSFDNFGEFFRWFIADALMDPTDPYLGPDLLEDIWRRTDGERPKRGQWRWNEGPDGELASLYDLRAAP
jgi:hypothetical protein